MLDLTVKFNDTQTGNLHSGLTLYEIIKRICPETVSSTVAGILNDQLIDLQNLVTEEHCYKLLTTDDKEGMQIFWHSSSHIMARAVKNLFPNAQLGIGPAISNGFYYDFALEEPFSLEIIEKIEGQMKRIIKNDEGFIHRTISKDEAIRLFESRGEKFKIELINGISGDYVSIYENGNFMDLCRGPHIPSTSYIRHFKLLNVAGAYWHGDERNPVMQRIYGISFPKQEKLDQYLQQLEEAKKRDHRRLGKELDLFSFQQEGPGFPFWHSKGMILYNGVIDYIREILSKHGYNEIKTPMILNEELWHRSGHWDNYKENMYFTTIDDGSFAVKPMNCPGGLLIYKNHPHSYRELPLKLSEMGLVHRHEKSGVLHGLFRVRQFTQDDAHVFCTPEQLENEIIKIIDLINEVYHTFGFKNYNMELSTRPDKSIGTDAFWKMAEKGLNQALKKKALKYEVNQGEGAFYGPKIDYHIHDSLGRIWQCGTIQVDFSMPERFDLEYIGSDGAKHRPVMIHRAILGSIERFIGILIEHYGGAFPLWLSPLQCVVIPIAEQQHSYARKVGEVLGLNNIRYEIDQRSEKMGYKIREWEMQKVPYMCIVGQKEMTEESVSVRKRKEGDLGQCHLSSFIEKLQDELHRRTPH